jgi:hypothetical protein
MKSLAFNEIKQAHLIGTWHVQSRLLSKSDPASIYATSDKHELSGNGNYKVTNGTQVVGTWSIFSEDEIIKNPLIKLTVNNETTNAIITLLKYSDDDKSAQLTLYLSTGLELVLKKDN